MQLTNFPSLLPAHLPLWERFQSINQRKRLPHALLIIGPQSVKPLDFSYHLSAGILCAGEQKPCGKCKSCRLIQSKEHPDVCYLEPDKAGGIIKIDQIRELHNLAFISPQLSELRVIIIQPAEKMNVAASNALLKLLEEPPASVIFLLLAEQISSIPATILSRCQQWRFSWAEILNADYLTMAEGYGVESVKGAFFNQLPTIIEELTALMSNKLAVCSLAQKWSVYELSHLLWLLYLLNSQMIAYHLEGRVHEKSWTESLYHLAQQFEPAHLFFLLDQINQLSKKLQQNLSLNQTIILESLLLAYKQKP